MRIEIFFNEDHPIEIPIQYNHIIQAMLLSWIKDKEYSTFIHDKGYQIGDKIYKLFTFSRINGTYRLDKQTGKIIFLKGMSLTISTMSDEFMGYLLNSVLLENRELNIGGGRAIINKVELKEMPVFTKNTFIHTLSPCTVYITLNNKKTRFFSPFDNEFNEYVKLNLIHKYEAFYGNSPQNTEFKITPVGGVKQAKVNYKNFHIVAYNCCMKMEGSEELKRVAYSAGLGAKNSQGFGCIEIQKEQEVKG